MSALQYTLVALASCLAGLAAILVVSRRSQSKKTSLRMLAGTTALQFALALVARFVVPWDDSPGGDEYRGPLLFIGTFVTFTLFHVGYLAIYLAKKEPIQPPQTTTGSSAPDRV